MTEQKPLPDGWIWTTLGKLGKFINGRAFKPSDWGVEGRPIIRIQNLTGSTRTINYYSGDVEQKFIIHDGDLLISWSATLGIYIYHGKEAVLNQHIFKVEPLISKTFLYYLANAYLDTLKRQVHGSGMQHITKDKFDNSPVPLPPLAEQERIVAKIEELFTQLDAGVASLKHIQARLKRYKASVLKAACEGRLVPQDPNDQPAEEILQRKKEIVDNIKYPSLPQKWIWLTLKDLSWDADYGTSQKCNYHSSNIPVIRIPNISNGSFDFSDIKFATFPEELDENKALKPNDFLIIRTNGSKTLIGRSCLVKQPFPQPTFFASYLIRYRLVINSVWISTIWNSEIIRNQIYNMSATSAGQYNISISSLNNILLPIPPYKEQERIISEVERLFSVIAELEQTVEKSLARAGRLRQSILQRAFEGRLI